LLALVVRSACLRARSIALLGVLKLTLTKLLMRRHITNAVWSTTGFIVPTAALVLTTPVFIRELGIEGFGVYALITTLLGMSGLASFGLTDATTKFVAEQSRRSKRRLVPLVQTSCALYLSFSVISGFLVYLLAPTLIDKLFNINTAWNSQAIAALEIGSLAFALRLIESFVSSISLGFSRYDWINKVDVTGGLLIIGSQTVLLLAGYGLVTLMACIAVVASVASLVKLLLAMRLVGGLHAFLPRLHRRQAQRLLSFSTFSWLQSINQILSAQADRLLIAGLLNTQALSYYVVCTRVASLVQILPARAASFIFPLASEQHAAGQLPKLRTTYFIAQNITIIVSLALAVPLFVYAPAVLTLWLGETVAANSSTLLRILVVTYALLAGSILPFYYLNGAGMPGLNAAFGWAGSALNIIALFLLLPGLQVIGAAAAKVVSHSLSLLCYPILHRRVFQDRRWYVGVLVVLPTLLIFALILPLLPITYQPTTIGLLLLVACASAVLTLMLAAPLVFMINPVLDKKLSTLARQLFLYLLPEQRST
jgi:O-antigen/teichoic acid export membrane protein